MAKRKKAIQDLHLTTDYGNCLKELIPLTPQCRALLFSLAEQVLQKKNLLFGDTRAKKYEAEVAWFLTPVGKIAKRKASEMVLETGYSGAKKWLEGQFFAANPEFKSTGGRPLGAKNRKTLLSLAAGEVIAELLNKEHYEA